jgi:hypothetical protein
MTSILISRGRVARWSTVMTMGAIKRTGSTTTFSDQVIRENPASRGTDNI